MCHPGFPFASHNKGVVVRGTRLVELQAPQVDDVDDVDDDTSVTRHPRRPEEARIGGGGCGGSGNDGSRRQYCLCSPTQHPGSFRCRQHRAQYVWRGTTV